MLILFLFYIITESEACVYSQSYWLGNVSEPWPSDVYPLNQAVCGLSWRTLMHLNTSQVRDSGATYWLLAFHQLCTAALNLHTQEASSSAVPSSVSLSINVIFDSMQRHCASMSAWVVENEQDTVLSTHLRRLIQFNHAGTPCDSTAALAFSFTQSPQLFFLGYNESEQNEAKRQAEVIHHVFKVQTILATFSGFAAFLVVPMLVIYIVMLKNTRREYSCCRDTTEVGYYDASGADDFNINDDQELDTIRHVKEKTY